MTEAEVAVDPSAPIGGSSAPEQRNKEESEDEAPYEISTKPGGIVPKDEANEDDDEDALILAKAKAEEAERRAASNKCDVCGENEKKYRCPKCDSRSCSLACSKKHKEDDKCDGVRGAWQPVAKVSRFNEHRVNEDAQFLNQVVAGVRGALAGKQQPDQQQQQGDQAAAAAGSAESSEGAAAGAAASVLQVPPPVIPEIPDCLPEGLREQASNQSERYLIGGCHKRRVFIYFDDEKRADDASRHEQFSDTLFWAVTLEFRRENRAADGSPLGTHSSYEYTVQQVPESINVRTVIKQFIKPRLHGPLVSKDELDLGQLQPFIDAGAEGIRAYMPAHLRGENKHYPVNPDATFLDNLRNRVVVNHPKLILCLLEDPLLESMQLISEEEQQAVADARKAIREARAGGPPRGGGGGGMRGGFRGGHFRGDSNRGGGGGFHQHHHHGGRGGGGGGRGGRGGGGGFRGGNKRPFEGGDRGGYGKRGRGGGGGGGGRQNYRNRDLDDFDPFEPFAGAAGAAMLQSWNAKVDRAAETGGGGEPSNAGPPPNAGSAGGGGAKNYFPDLDSLVGSSPDKK